MMGAMNEKYYKTGEAPRDKIALSSWEALKFFMLCQIRGTFAQPYQDARRSKGSPHHPVLPNGLWWGSRNQPDQSRSR